MRLNSVVLPEPFGPIRPTIWPSAIERSTCRTAARPPKYLETPSSSRIRLPRAPVRSGILDLTHGLFARPDQHLTAVLPLVRDAYDLAGAVGVELHRTIHRRHIRRRNVVPYGVLIQATGALDRVGENLDTAVCHTDERVSRLVVFRLVGLEDLGHALELQVRAPPRRLDDVVAVALEVLGPYAAVGRPDHKVEADIRVELFQLTHDRHAVGRRRQGEKGLGAIVACVEDLRREVLRAGRVLLVSDDLVTPRLRLLLPEVL